MNPYLRKKKISKTLKKKHEEDPEYHQKVRETLSKARKKQWKDPKFVAERKKQLNEQWSDPEYKEWRVQKFQEGRGKDFGEKISKTMKKKWKDPRVARQHSDSMYKKWDDPEYYYRNMKGRGLSEERIRELMKKRFGGDYYE